MDDQSSKIVGLQDRFYGCIAASFVGAAMGAAVDSRRWQDVQAAHGTLRHLLPYEKEGTGWHRKAGTTDAGVERAKLMITAIIEKGGRVTGEDVRVIWARDLKPQAQAMLYEPYEARLHPLAGSIVPARDFGRYVDVSGLVTFACACQPIGLINAGEPVRAGEDALSVGQLYHTTNGRGVQWAKAVAVAIAEATKPGASVDSILGKVYDLCDRDLVLRELDKQLTYSADCKDFHELRVAFDTEYLGHGMPHPCSFANEIVTKAFCVLRMTKGNAEEAIIASVNMGREAGSLASIAGGISGALCGASRQIREWSAQLDEATMENPYTCSKRTVEESCAGLYGAYQARLGGMERLIAVIDGY